MSEAARGGNVTRVPWLVTRVPWLIVAACCCLLAACEVPEETLPRQPGLHLESVDPAVGIRGVYVLDDGSELFFETMRRGDMEVSTAVYSTRAVLAEISLGDAKRDIRVNGINVSEAMRSDVLWAELATFARSPQGWTMMGLAPALQHEIPNADRSMDVYLKDFGLLTMLLQQVSGQGAVDEPPSDEPPSDDVLYGTSSCTSKYTAYPVCGDTCQKHRAGYQVLSDGKYDDFSDDVGAVGTCGGGYTTTTCGGVGGEDAIYGDCHGCCGPGCWGCHLLGDVYTQECLDHDNCVSAHGHAACSSGLGAAIQSYVDSY